MITLALESPMPSSFLSVPLAARSAISAGSVLRTTSRARWKALARKPVSWARSRQCITRSRAASGVIAATVPSDLEQLGSVVGDGRVDPLVGRRRRRCAGRSLTSQAGVRPGDGGDPADGDADVDGRRGEPGDLELAGQCAGRW